MFMFVVKHPRRPTQMSVSTDADVRIDRRRRPYRPTQTSVSTDADVRIDRRGCSSFCLEYTPQQYFVGSMRSVELLFFHRYIPHEALRLQAHLLAEWQHLVVELGVRAHAQHLLDDCILSILFSAVTIFSRSPLPFVERRSRCRPYFDRIWSFIISR